MRDVYDIGARSEILTLCEACSFRLMLSPSKRESPITTALVIAASHAHDQSMGRTADYSHQICSVAATLEVVGDPWTLLILRDAFAGVQRFEQWQEKLGVARNVLAARLKSLVGHGVLEKREYSCHPPRYEYLLTPKGRDLWNVLMTMAAWGGQHVYGDLGSPAAFIHKACGGHFEPGLICQCCGGEVGPGDLTKAEGECRATVGEAMAETLEKAG